MKVKAYKAYSARKATELSLAVDDIIEVEEKISIDQWKGILEKNGETGFFPTNCVVPVSFDSDTTPTLTSKKTADLSDSLLEKEHNSISSRKMPFKPLKQIGTKKEVTLVAARSTTPLELSGAVSSGGETAPKLPPKPVREQVRVIYAYKAQNEDELTIKEGDIITVIAKDNEDAGWWKGELNGRIALFPDNFVEVIQPSPPPPLPRPSDGDKARVKKPDRGTAPPPAATNNSAAPTPTASDSAVTATTATTTNNAFSSVPIIGKMLKFTQNSNTSSANISPQKSATDTSPQSSSANGSSKVADASDSSPADDDKSSKEDPFNAEPLSPSKLVHLTAQRPKIPSSSRRPPSMHLGKNTDSIDFMDGMEDNTDAPKQKASIASIAENASKIAPASIALKPVLKPEQDTNSSPEKKAPWLSDLKKAQERRRTNELNNEQNRKSINGPPAPTAKPHAPTPPGAKPFVANSKPSLLTTQHSAPGPDITHSNHIATTETTSPVATARPIIASSSHSTAHNTTNSDSAVNSTVPSTTSGSSTATLNGETALVDAKLLAARDEELSKMRSEMAELKTTVTELRTSVAELRKELTANLTNTKSQTEWTAQKAELEKQIQEQHNFFEAHKKNLTDMVKELINELAEEKKKIAGLQIEQDRMRKLTTTV